MGGVRDGMKNIFVFNIRVFDAINLDNSPGLWPTGVLDPSNFPSGLLVFLTCFLSLFPRASYQHALSRAWPLTGPGPPKPVRPVKVLAVPASFLRPLGHFFRIFGRLLADRKRNRIAPKRPKKQNNSTLGGLVSEKGSKKSTFGLPF